MNSQFQHKKDIAEVGRRLYQKGFVASADGNISVRISGNEILTTMTGVCKGLLGTEDIVQVDPQGKRTAGKGQPSSELKMHLLIYRERPDVKAVVHAHPPVSTGFAVAGVPLAQCILPEVVLSLGAVPIAAYGTPSTDEVCDAILPIVGRANAFLLANHGVVTLGEDVLQAYYRMETVEHFARILLTARMLGNVNVLSRDQVEKLIDVRKKAGVEGKFPNCESCGYCGGDAKTLIRGTESASAGPVEPRAAQAPHKPGASQAPRNPGASVTSPQSGAVPGSGSQHTLSPWQDKDLMDIITSVIKEITQEK